MSGWLFGWLWYLLPTGAGSYAAIFIHAKHDNMAFALVTGMLVGSALLMLFGSLYWENTDICDICLTGDT